MIKTSKEVRIACDCGSPGHFVSFSEWDGVLISAVCEADRGLPLWERCTRAWKYVMGHTDLNYIEVVFRPEHLTELKDFIERYESR